ncbi:hypothetical protein [Melittangium boletus]|uniref:hypothetical protein n=1 Tax=Melittangium boletus TaxID=83453 RepID=UPI003DA4BE41
MAIDRARETPIPGGTRSGRRLACLLGAQWLVLFPLALYASERFSDAYEYIEGQQEPLLVLPADPDATIHFGIVFVLLFVIPLVLLYLRPRQGLLGKLCVAFASVPIPLSLIMRFWVGCMTCTP